MSTYLVTGVSRGLGFELLRQISDDPSNIVVGLVRNKTEAARKVSDELPNRPNIHLVQADLDDYESIKRAANDTAELTNGALDYVIANAAFAPSTSFDPLGELGNHPEDLEKELSATYKTNVIGTIHLFNLFLPLVRKGQSKRLIAVSSGLADLETTRANELYEHAPYCISKAALNLAVAKFSTAYAKEGLLFMSICPGLVDTGVQKIDSPEMFQKMQTLFAKFTKYAPHFSGPATMDYAVRCVLNVIETASIVKGDGGALVSHKGNKEWI